MPTAAQMRQVQDQLHQEQARSKAYLSENQDLKKGLVYYEERIAELEAKVRTYEKRLENLHESNGPDLEGDGVALVVMRVNLQPLKQAAVRQQSYCDRQAEGYAKIIASIPSGNATLQAYYEAYVAEGAALEDLMLQIDEALRDA